MVCQIASIVVKLFNSMLNDYFRDVLNGVVNAMLIMLSTMYMKLDEHSYIRHALYLQWYSP